MPELRRPFAAAELSDGMLRYPRLVAALPPLRHAPFMALNQPETSLHESLIAPLAALIGKAAGRTQILVVAHSVELAERLELDHAAAYCGSEGSR